jgi:hypothetical protein
MDLKDDIKRATLLFTGSIDRFRLADLCFYFVSVAGSTQEVLLAREESFSFRRMNLKKESFVLYVVFSFLSF